MPRRLANLLLLGLVLGLVGSGLLGWILPVATAAPLYGLHRALGIALLVALLWKIAIARRSLARRVPRGDTSVAIGAGASLALVASVALGLAWTLGLVSFDSLAGYSALNIHVFLGLALVPLAAWHLAGRWETRPSLGRLMTRRATFRLVGLAAIAAALLPALDRLADATGARRITGSKHAGSFSGNAMPVTTWMVDAVPRIDAGSWRLAVGDRSLTFAELTALPGRELAAVLDCTGGWWSEQVWSGIRVGDVLELVGIEGDSATVTSVTGHGWTFPTAELKDALLATHLGGQPLTPAHGYPVRLVAPGRRGFQWIKWVARIELE